MMIDQPIPARNVSEVICLEESGYMNAPKLFFAVFGTLPSFMTRGNIPGERFSYWFSQVYGHMIMKTYQWERFDAEENGFRNVECHLVLDNGMVVSTESGYLKIYYAEEAEDFARKLMRDAGGLITGVDHKNHISLVYEGFNGLSTTPLRVKRPRLVLGAHYNDDLMPVYRKIVGNIRSGRGKGRIVLFSGEPGTGKSTLIRYMAPMFRKKVVFLPPALARGLDSPSATSFLMENANTVFVIEDAEELISSREEGRNSAMSVLLNITDGIIADSLGIYVIASFNTELRKIDKALLRKGRLMMHYRFGALERTKATQLLNKLGHDVVAEREMRLADIYNYGEDTGMPEEEPMARIGFRP